MELDPEILEAVFTNKGEDLKSLSDNQHLLLIFLRHFGCIFCKEAMTDIAKKIDTLEKKGVKLVLVHMANEELAMEYFTKYKMEGISHISDPDLSLYEYFGVTKGSFAQLYGLKIWMRALKVTLVDGHRLELKDELGEISQMPGVFVLKDGKVLRSYRFNSAADRPDYIEIVDQCLIEHKN